MNNDILKGLVALVLLTTLLWSLNLNFGWGSASWLEIFGGVSIGFMVGSAFMHKKNNE